MTYKKELYLSLIIENDFVTSSITLIESICDALRSSFCSLIIKVSEVVSIKKTFKMAKTNIQWTDFSWNIARGCTKVDEDCKFCYMYRDSFNNTRYNPLDIVRTKTVFNLPLRLKEPSKIFTCSLTDFFHEAIDGYRNEAWDIIRKCPQHTFQILTKRPERVIERLPKDWGYGWENVWIGTSIGSQKSFHRYFELLKIPAKTRFVSFEPLHGYIEMNIDLSDIMTVDWVIIGGESGNENGKYRYRPCDIDWIKELLYAFRSCGVPVFVKQLGTHLSKELKLSDRHGGNIEEWPEHLQTRQFPHLLNSDKNVDEM